MYWQYVPVVLLRVGSSPTWDKAGTLKCGCHFATEKWNSGRPTPVNLQWTFWSASRVTLSRIMIWFLLSWVLVWDKKQSTCASLRRTLSSIVVFLLCLLFCMFAGSYFRPWACSPYQRDNHHWSTPGAVSFLASISRGGLTARLCLVPPPATNAALNTRHSAL